MIVLLRFINFLKRKIGRIFLMVSPQKNYFPLKFNHNIYFFSNHFFEAPQDVKENCTKVVY
jgi:hypothetical protein